MYSQTPGAPRHFSLTSVCWLLFSIQYLAASHFVKLSSRFHLDEQLIMWTLDFLTNGSQRVLVNNSFSDLRYTSADPIQRRFWGGVSSSISKLSSFGDILLSFYYSFIESIVSFSRTCWFQSIIRLRTESGCRVSQCALRWLVCLLDLLHTNMINRRSCQQAGLLKTPHMFFTQLWVALVWRTASLSRLQSSEEEDTFVPKAILLLNS